MSFDFNEVKNWVSRLLAGGALGDATFTGDIAAAGGFRTMIGPFAAPGAAGVTAASQTNLDLYYEHSAGAAIDFVATRAGSIMGISGALSAAATGAGESITVKVTKNGTELVSGPELSFTADGAETKDSATAAKGTHTFAAGDTIGVSYTSTAISNTPKLVVTVEIEQ